ncbi:hypothetical protein EYC84_004517 [Monilinia fructicola]|uniref:Uncharacterized protein n=1 Tax=Monilinia fructicola TaxID=38448 RepID=A0A5M9K8Z4_MONFR|nr:hypothetical protein EYC84_004517 [Monilinia fructicola]
MDDKSSGKTRSSKGKKPARSKNVPPTTESSQTLRPKGSRTGSGTSLPTTPDLSGPDMPATPSIEDLRLEEERIRLEEDGEVERKRQAALRLAQERGLHAGDLVESVSSEPKQNLETIEDVLTPLDASKVSQASESALASSELQDNKEQLERKDSDNDKENDFVPARLPNFG